MELNEDDELLVRRKRVDEYGEWEYECRYCERWLPKSKFRGCVDYIDAYGNCLMCKNCIASKGQRTQKENMNKEVKLMLNNLNYDTSGEIPIWIQFHQRHNLSIKNTDN
jgi:hypothetical protein